VASTESCRRLRRGDPLITQIEGTRVPHRRSTRFFEQHPEAAAALEKWQKFGPFASEIDISTDYVAIAE
jgi:hypothetical protein